MKLKWTKDFKLWRANGKCVWLISRDSGDGQWDIVLGEGYLCSTRYIERAKWICEKLDAAH